MGNRRLSACHRETIAACRRIWSDNPDGNAANLAEARNGLALVYYEQRRYREADAEAREAKATWEKVDGPGSFGVASALNTLGFLFGSLQDFETADRNFRLALDIQKGRRDLLTANLLHNLASTRHQRGFIVEAEALYRESLCLQQELLPPQHPQLRKTLEAYAKMVKNAYANPASYRYKVAPPEIVTWCSTRETNRYRF